MTGPAPLPLPLPPRVLLQARVGVAGTGCRTPLTLVALRGACRDKWRAPCARRRHAYGALGIYYACARPKPAVPWAPEDARLAFSAMVAAVRARRNPRPLCTPWVSVRRHAGRC